MTQARQVRCAKPSFPDIPGILSDFEKVLASGRLMLGPFLARFEGEFAAYVGTRHAVAVSSCTAALEIVLRRLGLDGAEAVVPTNTFIASGNAVLYAGGRPVLADIDPRWLSLDLADLERRLTPRTKAVVLVHLGGLISPAVESIRELCARRGLALVEDCAHAHGAVFGGKKAGSFGLAGCFSFYPTKIMTTGAGGMITTDDADLAEYARSLRLHGRGSGARGGLDAIENLGNDWFLDEFRCALGARQLAGLEAALAHRRAVAQRYFERLEGVPSLELLRPDPRCVPSYYKFMVLLSPELDAPAVSAALQDRHGIEMERLYHPPCHLQPVYRRLFGFERGAFPVAEGLLDRQLCLPIHSGVTMEDAEYVAECLKEELRRAPARRPEA